MAVRRGPSSLSSSCSNSSSLSDSQKYSFHNLLDTSLPSPGLPSITPQHGRKPSARRFRMGLRLLFWACGVGVVLWFLVSTLQLEKSPSAIRYLSNDGEAYEIVGDDALPQQPSPVMVTDRRGRVKWTISIPPTFDFPLQPKEHFDICAQSTDVARHVAELKSHGSGHRHGDHFGYYHIDPNFMDVAEAEDHGMLPRPKSKQAQSIWEAVAGKQEEKDSMSEDLESMRSRGRNPVCVRSLTYVMETSDAGFGKTLMGLWMSYGLAKIEGRAFFIDDANWAYGKYTTFFQPPPIPLCLPPDKTQILPCPHHARHLLVSAATTPWTFGQAFNSHFEDAHKTGVKLQERIFSLLRDGHDALFHLADEDAAYVEQRAQDLAKPVHESGGITIGIHVRHGDRHPFEFQYQNSYIPLEIYVDAARALISAASTNATTSETTSRLLLASDDPETYTSLSNALRAQVRILLASKTTLDAATQNPPDSRQHKFTDENIGWEGGFFNAVFWSLGRQPSAPVPRSRGGEDGKEREEPSELALRLRELVGRAYLLDLAVLGRSDRVVCAVSSVGCRLLGVMMGWERGIVEGGWRNVDGRGDWRGIIW
ncbi:MAG: hypothetical protein M1830_001658 [Pleopsidium flavum]|nr:MAG: hypothetical protein M1830_001658 [Pleopsidium flavum]